MTEYVKSWFLRADDDLRTSQILLEENGTPNIICFHAQQAGEKYLKGFLAHHNKHARKIHDLLILLDECKEIEPSFEQLEGDISYLNQFYIETRYPGDYPEFTLKEAKEAFESAAKIKTWVLEKTKLF